MQLDSVNIGSEQVIHGAKRSERTGIFKEPVTKPVFVSRDGLPGDVIIDTKHHGGPDQALYVYGTADYDAWAEQLGRAMAPGTFGENLTIGGLRSAEFSVGDRLHIGPVVLEVTAPRIPCVTLAARMDDPEFVKKFRYAERPGLYCRVIQEGQVQAGMPVTVERYGGETITILEMYRDAYEPRLDEATLRRFLNAPIAIRDRVEKEAALQKVTGADSVGD